MKQIRFKPDPIIKGNCFICKENCKENAYCHFECANAHWKEQDKRIKEADKKERDQDGII
jgi:hypothetical protein